MSNSGIFACVKRVNEPRKTSWRIGDISSTSAQKNVRPSINNVYNAWFSQNSTLQTLRFLHSDFMLNNYCCSLTFTHFPLNL